MSDEPVARPTPPVALSIAGSDSGGGAGIAADLRTFAAHGVYGTFAITAITAQDTKAVHAVLALSDELVNAQLDAVLFDFEVRAAKTGMLATPALVELVAERAAASGLPQLVVDPVMVSASGAPLLAEGTVPAYARLLAFARVVTPNLAEAEALTGRVVRDLPAMREAARALVGLGVEVALVKGGHLAAGEAIDVVYDGSSLYELSAPRIATNNTHGTGCTLSAAICANLARGEDLLVAIEHAKDYVGRAIRASAAYALGHGPGPLEHFPDRPSAPAS